MRIRAEGLTEASRSLRRLADREIATAIRNTINDTARDVIKRQELEISKVFDRPTPKVQRPFYLEKATKENLVAEIRIKDVYGKGTGRALPNTLEPHIPGFPAARHARGGGKGMEIALRRKGLLGPGEFLVPSRTMKLDKYGNISGSLASKMLSDLWVWAGDDGARNTGSGGGKAKAKFIWGQVTPRGRAPTKGIWMTSRFRGRKQAALMMVVVQGKPTYAKRLRFHEIGRKEAERAFPRRLEQAIDHAIRRSRQ